MAQGIKQNTDLQGVAAREKGIEKYGRIGGWFQIICCMNIPVFGFFYLLVMAFSRKTEIEKKAFAKAYLIFRFLVLLLAIVILYVFYRIGLDLIGEILTYADRK